MVHLPDEMWLKVTDYFNPLTDICTPEFESFDEHETLAQPTLINLCLVSKQLRAISQPQLYHSFIKHSRICARDRLLTPESEWLHKYYQRDEQRFRINSKETRLEKFIRTLINRPDLAVVVKQLRVGWFFEISSLPVRFQRLYERLPLDVTPASTFVNTLRRFQGFERLCHRTRKSWLTDLRTGEEGAEVGLLLILLPNLHSLRITSGRGGLGRYAEELYNTLSSPRPTSWTIKSADGMLWKHPVESISHMQQLPQIFGSLTSLHVWSIYGSRVSLQRCMDILTLSSLTSFEGRALEQISELTLMGPDLDFPSLQHLTLLHCRLSGSAIQALLMRCTKLKSFILNSEHAFNAETPIFTLGAGFFAAVQNLAGSLEHLVLLVTGYTIDADLDISSCERLHYLEVNESLFSDDQVNIHDNLPTSIQQLVIRRTTIWIKPYLESMFDTFIPTPKFPDLTLLRLYTPEEEQIELEKELIGIQKRAQQYLVDVGIEREAEKDHRWILWLWMMSFDAPDSDGEDSDSVSLIDEDSDGYD